MPYLHSNRHKVLTYFLIENSENFYYFQNDHLKGTTQLHYNESQVHDSGRIVETLYPNNTIMLRFKPILGHHQHMFDVFNLLFFLLFML